MVFDTLCPVYYEFGHDIMKTIKIFLGGGVSLLEGDEKSMGYRPSVVDPAISKLNARTDADRFFIVKTFSDLIHEYCPEGQQEHYHRFLEKEADIALFIFDGSIGDKTRSEVERACNNNGKHGHPTIFFYGTNLKDDDEIVSYLNSKNQYFQHFTNTVQLTHMIQVDLSAWREKTFLDRLFYRICRLDFSKRIFFLLFLTLFCILLGVFVLSGRKNISEKYHFDSEETYDSVALDDNIDAQLINQPVMSPVLVDPKESRNESLGNHDTELIVPVKKSCSLVDTLVWEFQSNAYPIGDVVTPGREQAYVSVMQEIKSTEKLHLKSKSNGSWVSLKWIDENESEENWGRYMKCMECVSAENRSKMNDLVHRSLNDTSFHCKEILDSILSSDAGWCECQKYNYYDIDVHVYYNSGSPRQCRYEVLNENGLTTHVLVVKQQ